MNTKPVAFWAIAICFPLMLSVASSAAYGQQPSLEQLKTMPPEALIQAWENADRNQRSLFLDALIENRSSSLPALRDAVLKGTSSEKLIACALIAEMRDKDSVITLLAATSDPDEQVRTRAITALRLIGDPRAVPRLRELVQTTPEGPVLKSSLAALGTLGGSEDISLIQPSLFHSDESVRVNAAAALALLGNSDGQSVLLASSHSENSLARLEATVALGYLNTLEARTRLQEIINDPEGRWKNEAHVALAQQDLTAKLTTSEKIGYLMLLTQDQNRLVARWAVAKLADLNTPEATQLMRELADKGGKLGQQAHRLLKVKGER